MLAIKTIANEVQEITNWCTESIFAIARLSDIGDLVLERIGVIGFIVSRQTVKIILYKFIKGQGGTILDSHGFLYIFQVGYFNNMVLNKRDKGNRGFT